ncbi:MAG: MATE family efflux transporter [Bacilli bacterium]|nr:MATE family efflux transporter [Bacilli bacterium]MDD4057138.1 MATE family efflux transporter [Bacilli bacterium]
MNILLSQKIKNYKPNWQLPQPSKILNNILKISVPAALEVFLIGLIGMFDTMMVGRLGDAAIASVALTQQPLFITLSAGIGLNAGVIAIIARKRGQQDQEGANNYLRQSLMIGVMIAIVMTILAFFLAKPFLLLAGAKDDTIDNSVLYFRIVSSILILNYIRLIITSALRACGNTKTTLATNVTANIINVFLNYCLINGNLGFPALGIKGAAIATIIGNLVAFVISIFAIYNRRNQFLSVKLTDNWRLDKESCGQIFRISSSAFVEQLGMRVGFFISAKIVNSLGTEAVAVNAIIQSIISLSFNITDGFAIGASSLVGKSLGEKREELAFAYGRMTQILSFFIGLFMFTFVIIARTWLASLFSKEFTTIQAASDMMLFAAFIIFPQSLQWVTTGILRGAGDTRYTARSSLISVMVIRPVLSYTICYLLGFGLIGSWIGMFIDQIIRFLLNNARFTNLKWIRIKI